MNATAQPRRSLARIYLLEAQTEFLKAWRLPVYSVFTLAFPLMFYLIFGMTFGGQAAGAVNVAAYMLATYGAFGVIGASLFGLASERGQGWMRLKRASPMPPVAYFTAKIIMALLFSLLVVIGLFLFGFVVFSVRLPLTTWGALLGTLLLGALPFCAFGMMLGYLAGPNSAAAVVNLVYLPMAFVSGLWVPLEQLPEFVQRLAPFLPAYHYVQLALGTLGVGRGEAAWVHVAALLGFTALFLLVALGAYRRDEGRTYG